MAKEESHSISSAEWKSNIEIRTPDQELFEEILNSYQGKIFPEQIRGEHSKQGLASTSNYSVGALSLDILETILQNTNGNYEVYINHNKKQYFVIGRKGRDIWLSE